MDTNTTAQTAQWATELINKVDLLAAAIALAIIVHAIKPLFIGLRNFWKDYAIHSGGHWIGRQKTWLNQHSKFALAEWWGDATGNITSAIDRIYGFIEPKPESEKSEHESKQPSDNAISDANPGAAEPDPEPSSAPPADNRSFIDQMFSSWRHFRQRQAFTRALFIAYIYFYGFCLLLAFDELPEATTWQLFILLVANLALLVVSVKWKVDKTDAKAFTSIFTLAGAFTIAFTFAISVDFAFAANFTFAVNVAFAGAFAGAIASAIIFARARAIAGAGAVVFAGAYASAGAIEFGVLRLDAEWSSSFLVLAALALYFSNTLRSLLVRLRLDVFAHAVLPWALLLFNLTLLYYFYLILSLTSPTLQPTNLLQLISVQAEALVSNPDFYLVAFMLLFLVFPWVNAALDWLSVSASRAAFYLLHRDLSAEQREDRAYGKAFLHLALDLVLALAFKLTVLLLLYIYAQLYGEFGVSFSVDTVKDYWSAINPLDSRVDFSWGKIWDDDDHKFITLMVSTTLLPTLLHFGWVLLYVLCRSLWTLLRLLFAFAVSEAATFAATISVLITVAALTALTMAIKPPKPSTENATDDNKINGAETSELLIPPPSPHL